MHEVALMTEAVRLAVESAQSAGRGRMAVLRLRVGTLSGAVPAALEFAWEVVRRGTLAETARLEIETVPVVCWCAACQMEFAGADFFNECPGCHQVSGELRRGRELEIAALEFN